MRIYFLLLLSFFFHAANNQCIAQETVKKFKKRVYKTRLISYDSATVKGFLTDISDSSVLISSQKQRFGTINAQENKLKNIHYSGISEMVVKRKGRGERGFIIGALSGLTIGILIGVAEDRRMGGYEYVSSGVAYGALGFVGGGLFGMLVSSAIKKTFVIGGKKEKFDSMRATVLEKTYSKSSGK